MAISGFELFLIAGGNPSNILSALYRGETECPHPWAIKFLYARHRGEAVLSDRSRAFICPHSTRIDESALERWAITESLNFGSYQRAELPTDVFPFLKGSGRWLAGDRGGWDRLLLEAVLAWMDTEPGMKAAYKRAAGYLSSKPPKGLEIKQEPYTLDRGKLFERMASAIFSVREAIMPPDHQSNFEGGPSVIVEIGLDKAEVLIGDCVPRWLGDVYDGKESEKLDNALASMTEVDPRGLAITCGAPWEYQRGECLRKECEECLYEKSYRIVTISNLEHFQEQGSSAA